MSAAPAAKKSSKVVLIVGVVVALLAVVAIRQLLFPGASGGSLGKLFGNVVVKHAWYERGFLPAKVEYLVVVSEVPVVDKSGYPDNWTIGFAGGKQYTVNIGSDQLTWVDAASGPKYHKLALTKDLLDKIEARSAAAGNQKFSSPEEFLKFVNGN
jgi:hypothetical protein